MDHTAAALPVENLYSLCLASGSGVPPTGILHAWSLSPFVLVPLGLSLVIYIRGARLLKDGPEPRASSNSSAYFLAGWVVLVVALVSPLCRLSATLASAHMVQFTLLTVLAPGLIAAGRPFPALVAGSQIGRRNRGTSAEREESAVPIGWVSAIYGALIWLWHLPQIYEATLTNSAMHLVMYAAVIAASLWFWHSVLMTRSHRMAAIGALFTTVLHTGLLGALLTFAPKALYPVLSQGAIGWGLSPLSDQQLAGLVMWVVCGLLYTGAALGLVWQGLAELERKDRPALGSAV